MSTDTADHGENQAKTAYEVMQLDPLAFAGAAAVVSSVIMFLLGVFGTVGVYEGAVEMMQQWHMFFEPTVLGTVAGMIEAAVISFVFVYLFAWLYNVFAR